MQDKAPKLLGELRARRCVKGPSFLWRKLAQSEKQVPQWSPLGAGKQRANILAILCSTCGCQPEFQELYVVTQYRDGRTRVIVKAEQRNGREILVLASRLWPSAQKC